MDFKNLIWVIFGTNEGLTCVGLIALAFIVPIIVNHVLGFLNY